MIDVATVLPTRSAGGRVPLRDRSWVDQTSAAIIGGVSVPERDRLVAAVVTLAAGPSFGRLAWQVSPDGRRWTRRPDIQAAAEAMVVEGPPIDAADESAIATGITGVIDRADVAWPIGFVRGPDYLVVRFSHLFGDGLTATSLVADLLRTAQDGQPPPPDTRPQARLPYPRAASDYFLKRPRAVVETFANARKRAPAAPASAGPTTPWVPQRSTVYSRMSAEAYADLRRWRKANASGATVAALELSLVLKAARAAGLAIQPAVAVLFDLRRYLPRHRVEGNFVIGLDLPITADSDPVAISQLFADTAISGRPLAAAGVAMATQLRKSPSVTERALNSPMKLAFSNMGRPRDVERLTWNAGSPTYFTGSSDPAAPDILTVIGVETKGAPQLSGSFHRNVADADLVRLVLGLATDDPVALMSGRG